MLYTLGHTTQTNISKSLQVPGVRNKAVSKVSPEASPMLWVLLLSGNKAINEEWPQSALTGVGGTKGVGPVQIKGCRKEAQKRVI